MAASAERDVRDSATLLLLDGSESAEQIEQTRRFYESNAEAVEIVGLDVVGSWIVRHPANNQEMAVVAVKWSGASQKAAQDLKRSMQAAQRDLREKVAKDKVGKGNGAGYLAAKQREQERPVGRGRSRRANAQSRT